VCAAYDRAKATGRNIWSEGVFIDDYPLGEAAASKQTQRTSSIFEFGSGALRIFE
jgi:hypothetical protein